MNINDRIVWIDVDEIVPHLKGRVIEKDKGGLTILYENGRSIFYTNDKLEVLCDPEYKGQVFGHITLDKEYYREQKLEKLLS